MCVCVKYLLCPFICHWHMGWLHIVAIVCHAAGAQMYLCLFRGVYVLISEVKLLGRVVLVKFVQLYIYSYAWIWFGLYEAQFTPGLFRDHPGRLEVRGP